MRYLGDRENENQIEEQFGVGDAAVLVRHDWAKQRAALIVPRHGAPCPPDF
jgi:hypothetical protein